LFQNEIQKYKKKRLYYKYGLPGHIALFHHQNKLFKNNRQTNAVNIQQVYILNCKKSERPLSKNSFETKFRNLVKRELGEDQREEIHNQVILKLGSGRVKKICNRLRTL